MLGRGGQQSKRIKPCIDFSFFSPLQPSSLPPSLYPSIQVSRASCGHCVSPDPAAENVEISGPGPNRTDEFSHENRRGSGG